MGGRQGGEDVTLRDVRRDAQRVEHVLLEGNESSVSQSRRASNEHVITIREAAAGAFFLPLRFDAIARSREAFPTDRETFLDSCPSGGVCEDGRAVTVEKQACFCFLFRGPGPSDPASERPLTEKSKTLRQALSRGCCVFR